VHAHPDDESSKGAASTARYVAEGVDVHVVTCTGGERGSVLNPKMDRPDVLANISEIRRQEMERARDILGVTQDWLGFVDSGWPEGDPKPPLPEGSFALVPRAEAAAPLVRLVRDFRPHVILAYDETGGYPHPDHIKAHQVAVEAFEAAADPDRYREAGGEPWQPLKMYYFVSFHRAKYVALHEELVRRGLDSPYSKIFEEWEERARKRLERGDRPLEITTQVTAADYFAIRDDALRAHATQIDPDSSWFACPRDVERAAWPTEDYHLARSLIDTELPEDDLFAGIRESVTL
jgi:mycothiol S-conjugate amidase